MAGWHYRDLKLERAFDREQRASVLRKQNGRCKYCLDRLTMKQATRDHVIPRSKGGSNLDSNIVVACSPCNLTKGSLPVKQFLRLITSPRPGEPTRYLLIWCQRRLNLALDRMERNVMRAIWGANWES